MSTSANKPALKQLQCPNCGAALSQYTPGAQSLVCPACNSYVAVGAGDPEVIGKTRGLPKPPVPIKIGDTFTLDGTAYFVMGRVMYKGWDDEDNWRWNEWLLGADDGRMLWLSYDEKGFSIYTKQRFRAPFDAQRSHILEYKDTKIPIRERYPAVILGAEGELTWRASENERLYMAEGARGGKRYSVQQTDQELEVYEGHGVMPMDIAKALGDEKWQKQIKAKEGRAATMKLIAAMCVLFAVAALSAALMVSAIGENVTEVTVPLRTSTASSVPVDFNNEGRPSLISMTLSGNLPENTYMDVDLSVVAPNEVETFVFTKSFWHETGYDDEGFWRDIQSKGNGMFVPLMTGEHKIKLQVDDTSFTGDLSANVKVRRNIWVAQWFIAYAVIIGLIGVVMFVAVPNTKK